MIIRLPRLASPARLAAATAALVAFGALSPACAEDAAQFDVNYAPDFQKMTVSVVGVFREGRLSPETWDDLGPKISPVFGAGVCPIAYDAKLLTDKPDLASAIDDYSRANGMTDDLLDQLAPAAKGDALLVITVAGHPTKAARDPGIQGPPQAPTAPTSGRGGSMGGMNGMGTRAGHGGMGNPTPMRAANVDRNAYEMSASLFSLKDHKTVALVHMGYSGASADEALARFTEKLKSSLTGFPCVGWNMEASIDEKKIKALETE